MKVLYRILLTLTLVLALDGISQVWVEHSLEPFQPVSLAGDYFRLTLGYNTGVAFGMFANGGVAPLVVTGLVILGLMVWFARALKAGQFPQEAGWPIGLLLGGAIANFADRLIDGRVTDFLDVGLRTARWPTFNLADSFIMLGITGLLLLNYWSGPHSLTSARPEELSAGE
jgi:signal peptidase II